MTVLEIPNEVVEMNLSANGAAGRAWLDSLPGLVDELTDRWSLTIGPAFGGGAVGFVAPAERRGGERLVLKVSFVDDETRYESDALRHWDADGAVRLVDADAAMGALLLERLDPGTRSKRIPTATRRPGSPVRSSDGSGARCMILTRSRSSAISRRD